MKTPKDPHHHRIEKSRALCARILHRKGCVRTEINVNSLMGHTSFGAMLRWTFPTKQNTAILSWIRNVAFMDSDATLFTERIRLSTSSRNGTQFTLTTVRLFWNHVNLRKVDYWRFWANRANDIYIFTKFIFSCITTFILPIEIDIGVFFLSLSLKKSTKKLIIWNSFIILIKITDRH